MAKLNFYGKIYGCSSYILKIEVDLSYRNLKAVYIGKR